MANRRFDAGKSLFTSTALAGNVGKAPQDREQTVFTPRWFLEGLKLVLGPDIGLDPCTTEDNPVEAFYAFTEEDNGLEQSWRAFDDDTGWVFVNPPFNDLEAWMQKCGDEADRSRVTIALLCPFRPHRTWFHTHTENADAVYALAPFPFVGSKSAFPAPLCLITWNAVTVREIRMPMARGRSKNIVLRKYLK